MEHAQALKRLSALVQFEADLRSVSEAAEVGFVLANSIHKIVPNEHVVLWSASKKRITTISGGLQIDPQAPQIRWFRDIARHIVKQANTDEATPVEVLAESLPVNLRPGMQEWIKSRLYWVPIRGPKGNLLAGMFLLKNQPASDAESHILERISKAAGFVLAYHDQKPKSFIRRIVTGSTLKWLRIPVFAALIAVLFIPIEQSILAPARSAPSNPAAVTAPMDGILARVIVEPSQSVVRGQVIAEMDTVELKAAFELAKRRVAVLAADLKRTTQRAFVETSAKAEMALLVAQMRQSETELELARSRLLSVTLTAPIDGIVIISGKTDWIGRPVSTGEHIMMIADLEDSHLEIFIPVEDAVIVDVGSRVQFFSSISPTKPIEATLESVAYAASQRPDQSMAFYSVATFKTKLDSPRLGFTGTAKIYSGKVPLYYALFRKPASAVRRMLGL